MAYDIGLEKRIDGMISRWKGFEKKKMFGGICYLVGGNMSFGIWKNYLIVRAGPEEAENKMKLKHTKPFDITGRMMKGWIMVEKKGYQRESDMKNWLDLGRLFAEKLPKKNK